MHSTANAPRPSAAPLPGSAAPSPTSTEGRPGERPRILQLSAGRPTQLPLSPTGLLPANSYSGSAIRGGMGGSPGAIRSPVTPGKGPVLPPGAQLVRAAPNNAAGAGAPPLFSPGGPPTGPLNAPTKGMPAAPPHPPQFALVNGKKLLVPPGSMLSFGNGAKAGVGGVPPPGLRPSPLTARSPPLAMMKVKMPLPQSLSGNPATAARPTPTFPLQSLPQTSRVGSGAARGPAMLSAPLSAVSGPPSASRNQVASTASSTPTREATPLQGRPLSPRQEPKPDVASLQPGPGEATPGVKVVGRSSVGLPNPTTQLHLPPSQQQQRGSSTPSSANAAGESQRPAMASSGAPSPPLQKQQQQQRSASQNGAPSIVTVPPGLQPAFRPSPGGPPLPLAGAKKVMMMAAPTGAAASRPPILGVGRSRSSSVESASSVGSRVGMMPGPSPNSARPQPFQQQQHQQPSQLLLAGQQPRVPAGMHLVKRMVGPPPQGTLLSGPPPSSSAHLAPPSAPASANVVRVPESTVLGAETLPEAAVRSPAQRRRRMGESSDDSDEDIHRSAADHPSSLHGSARGDSPAAHQLADHRRLPSDGSDSDLNSTKTPRNVAHHSAEMRRARRPEGGSTVAGDEKGEHDKLCTPPPATAPLLPPHVEASERKDGSHVSDSAKVTMAMAGRSTSPGVTSKADVVAPTATAQPDSATKRRRLSSAHPPQVRQTATAKARMAAAAAKRQQEENAVKAPPPQMKALQGRRRTSSVTSAGRPDAQASQHSRAPSRRHQEAPAVTGPPPPSPQEEEDTQKPSSVDGAMESSSATPSRASSEAADSSSSRRINDATKPSPEEHVGKTGPSSDMDASPVSSDSATSRPRDASQKRGSAGNRCGIRRVHSKRRASRQASREQSTPRSESHQRADDEVQRSEMLPKRTAKDARRSSSSSSSSSNSKKPNELTSRELYHLVKVLRDTKTNILALDNGDHHGTRQRQRHSPTRSHSARDRHDTSNRQRVGGEDSEWGLRPRGTPDRYPGDALARRATSLCSAKGSPWHYGGDRRLSGTFATPPPVRRPLGYINVGGGRYARVGGSPYTRARTPSCAGSVGSASLVIPGSHLSASDRERVVGPRCFSVPRRRSPEKAALFDAWSYQVHAEPRDLQEASTASRHRSRPCSAYRDSAATAKAKDGDSQVPLAPNGDASVMSAEAASLHPYQMAHSATLSVRGPSPFSAFTGGGGGRETPERQPRGQSPVDGAGGGQAFKASRPGRREAGRTAQDLLTTLRRSSFFSQLYDLPSSSPPPAAAFAKRVASDRVASSGTAHPAHPRPSGDDTSGNSSGGGDAGGVEAGSQWKASALSPQRLIPTGASSTATSERDGPAAGHTPVRRRLPSPSAAAAAQLRSPQRSVRVTPGGNLSAMRAHSVPSHAPTLTKAPVYLTKATIARLSTPQQRRIVGGGGSATAATTALLSPIPPRRFVSGDTVHNSSSGSTSAQMCCRWLDELMGSTTVTATGVLVGGEAVGHRPGTASCPVPVVDLRRDFKPSLREVDVGEGKEDVGGGNSRAARVSADFVGSRPCPHIPGISFKHMVGARSATRSVCRSTSPASRKEGGEDASTTTAAVAVKAVHGVPRELPFRAYSSFHIHDPARKSPWALAPERDGLDVLPGKPALARRRRVPLEEDGLGVAATTNDADDDNSVSRTIPGATRTVVEEVHLDEHHRPYLIVRPVPSSEEVAAQRLAMARLARPKSVYRRAEDLDPGLTTVHNATAAAAAAAQ